jgi:hypothetical protein
MKNVYLYLLFYKSFAAASIAVSIGAVSIVYVYGIGTFLPIFWFKVFTLLCILYANHKYKSNEYYFFLNLGIPKRNLWIFSGVFDMIVFTALLILSLKIR